MIPCQNSAWERACHSSWIMRTDITQNKEIDRIETGETGQPKLALVEIAAAVGVVVGKDVAGDEEEDSNEDVSVVDEGIEKAKMRWGEVEEDDEDGEEGADAGECGQLRLSRGRRLRSCCGRLMASS